MVQYFSPLYGWLKAQNTDGGWSYVPGNKSTLGIAANGVAGLVGTLVEDPAVSRQHVVTDEDGYSETAEAYRQVRTNLQFLDVIGARSPSGRCSRGSAFRNSFAPTRWVKAGRLLAESRSE